MTEEDIPGWFDECFRGLYAEMVEAAPTDRHSLFVEVGCWKGKSTVGMGRMILASGKPISLLAIDHCKGSPGYDETLEGYGGCAPSSEAELRGNLKVCGVEGVVALWAMPSLSAAAAFSDGELDFVFIDGDHREEAVYADCRAWWPKVRAGGYLCGHDRGLPGVDAGVRRFAREGRLSFEERETVWVIRKG